MSATTVQPHTIITGGSSGIGLEVARQLSRRGHSLTLIARGEERLNAARELILTETVGRAGRILLIPADVSIRSACETAIQQSIADLGTPALLITSAGIARPGKVETLEPEWFEQQMQINYFGSLYAVKAALPAMLAARAGRIVLVSSGAGLTGFYGYSAYAPTKFALRGLAEVLRNELCDTGVATSIVYPPDTDTPQLADEAPYKPAATKLINATAKTWQPDAVATHILAGLDKKRFAITPGWEMTWLSRLNNLINPLLFRYYDSLVRKAARKTNPHA